MRTERPFTRTPDPGASTGARLPGLIPPGPMHKFALDETSPEKAAERHVRTELRKTFVTSLLCNPCRPPGADGARMLVARGMGEATRLTNQASIEAGATIEVDRKVERVVLGGARGYTRAAPAAARPVRSSGQRVTKPSSECCTTRGRS